MIMALLENETAHFAGNNQQRLVLSLMAVPRHANMDKVLTYRASAAEAAGMQLKNRAGHETQWYFDPTDAAQAAAALKLVGSRRKRTVSPETAARLAAIGFKKMPIVQKIATIQRHKS